MLFPSIRSPTKIRAPAGFEGEIYSGFARKCQKEGEEKKTTQKLRKPKKQNKNAKTETTGWQYNNSSDPPENMEKFY